MKRTWFAIESNEPEVNAPEGIETELLEVPSETVEAVQAETAQVDMELEVINEDLEEMEADEEAITRTEEAIDKSLEDEGDGLDETAVEIATEALNSYTRRWGIKAPVVSVEDFGNEQTRREATLELKRQVQVAREGLAGRFVEWVKALLESFKNFVKGIFSKGQALQNRAAKYKKALKSDKLKDAKFEGEIELKGAQGLVINGKSDLQGAIKFAHDIEKIITTDVKAWSVVLDAQNFTELADKLKGVKISHPSLPGNVTLVNEGGRLVSEEKEIAESAVQLKCLGRDEIAKAADGIEVAGKVLAGNLFKNIEKEANKWIKLATNDDQITPQEAKLVRSGMSSAISHAQKLAKATEKAAAGIDKAIVASLKKAGVKGEVEAEGGDKSTPALPAPTA